MSEPHPLQMVETNPSLDGPAARLNASRTLTLSSGIAALGVALALGLELPISALWRSLLLAASLWILSGALSWSLSKGWGSEARVALVYFLAGAVLTSIHLWPNPSEISNEGSPGWLGLWLVAIPLALRLPWWAGGAGLLLAWASLGARSLVIASWPELDSLLFASVPLALCALGSGLSRGRRDGALVPSQLTSSSNQIE
tara:strand:+ start:941 stop:1540 length:600 start_codon:yes stop_codon:yes gene_type:complete